MTTGQVHVVGEVTTTAKEAFADITNTVRARILDIGYDSSDKGFDGASCGVNIGIGAQSPDIAQGVDTAHEARVEGAADPLDAQGAGDQGLMFGYAINDTPERMPLPIALAHRLSRKLTEVRKDGTLPYLRPDGKTQVTIAYEDDVPVRLDTVVVSTQHADGIDLVKTLDPDIRRHVLTTVLDELAHDTLDASSTRVLVNPTGKFVLGGPMGDAGLTGRKIIVDTYGGWARHGGGAFSGKDPSKVDRSAAYAMRWVAKKHRRGRAGGASRGPGGLRHRQGRSGRAVHRDVRYRDGRSGQDREDRARGVRPAARRDHPRPGPAAPDLRADRRVRALRPHRHRAAMGAGEQGRRPQTRHLGVRLIRWLHASLGLIG